MAAASMAWLRPAGGVAPREGSGDPGLSCRFRSSLLFGLLLISIPSRGAAAVPSSTVDCALQVPLEEVRRGKGAFLSGCETLSEGTNLGGCWTQPDNDETIGCQTCYIAEEAFAGGVFPVMFSEELDPCPSSTEFHTLYEAEYGEIAVVTAASLTSSGCPEGWLYSKETDHCYFKSLNTAKSANKDDAAVLCEAEGGWVIAMETEAENNFLLNNMLWIGFFGETYTGMIKEEGSAEWAWPAEAADEGGTGYDCLVDYSNWLEGPTVGCAAEYNDGAEGASCMEIYPYEPKGWNPFSCNVGKHYVCEMPATPGGTTSMTSSSSSTVSTADPTQAPSIATNDTTPVPTPAPTKNTAQPTPSPTVKVALTPGPTVLLTTAPTAQPSGVVTDVPDTVAPTIAPTASSRSGGGNETENDYEDPTLDPTLAPTSAATSEATNGSVEPESWAGDNKLTIIKSGSWGTATCSLYLVEGDEETVVAEGVEKDGVLTVEDDYLVKAGCYRLQVSAGVDPSEFSWDVTGASPSGGSDRSSGSGLDGSMFTIGGGVCGVGKCQSECLADYFSESGDGGSAASNDVCDGLSTLMSGACVDICTGDDAPEAGSFEQICVNTECDTEAVCGIEADSTDLSTGYMVEVKALLLGGAASASSSGNAEEEFGAAVASWLGVDEGDVSVTALNGASTAQEAEDGDEDDTSPSARRLGGSLSDVSRRGLQTESGSSSVSDGSGSSEYSRYTCRVQPEDSSFGSMETLRGQAVEEGSGSALQSWLGEGGGTWSDATVVDVEAEVMQEVALTREASSDLDAAESSNSKAWYEDDPLATGGVAAGAVVLLGIAVIWCFMCRAKSADAAKRTERCPSGAHPLTGDFEGAGNGFTPSDAIPRQSSVEEYGKTNTLPPKNPDSKPFGQDRKRAHLKEKEFQQQRSSHHLADAAGGGVSVDTGKVLRTGTVPGSGETTKHKGLAGAEKSKHSAAVAGSGKERGGKKSPFMDEYAMTRLPKDEHADALETRPLAQSSASEGGGIVMCDVGLVSSGDDRAITGENRGRRGSRSGNSQDVTSTTSFDVGGLHDSPFHRVTGSANALGRGASQKPHHQRSCSVSSKVSVNSNATDGTSASNTRRPSLRGPSGALATLGLGRTESNGFGSQSDGDESWDYGAFDEGASMAGESEAGSRYMAGGYEAYGMDSAPLGPSVAETRIKAMQRSDRALHEVNVAPKDAILPSPKPFSPTTDWELAQDLAPTPNEATIHSRGKLFVSPAHQRQFTRQKKNGPVRQRRAEREQESIRPPAGPSGAWNRSGKNAPGSVGGGDSDAASMTSRSPVTPSALRSTPQRSSHRGTASRRALHGGIRGSPGSAAAGIRGAGGIGDADSDCESRVPGSSTSVTPTPNSRDLEMNRGSGNRVGSGTKRQQRATRRDGLPSHSRAAEYDSDGESRFYSVGPDEILSERAEDDRASSVWASMAGFSTASGATSPGASSLASSMFSMQQSQLSHHAFVGTMQNLRRKVSGDLDGDMMSD